MTTFAKATFNGNLYGAARPTYPKQLFDLVFRYHEAGSVGFLGASSGGPSAKDSVAEDLKAERVRARARWDCAVDLGCGTGQSTIELHPFKRVVGVDPSKTMLDRARQYVKESLGHVPNSSSASSEEQNQIEFVQSSAENLSFLADGSTDLVVSSQAAHWLNWARVWPELARILRPGGTAAFWCYSQMRLPQYPSTLPLIERFIESESPEEGDPTCSSEGPLGKMSIASYWEQPGRRIVDNHLRDVPDASKIIPEAFDSEERVYFSGSYHPSLPNPQPVILRKSMSFDQFEGYIRTLSAYHTFRDANPDDANNTEGDVVTRFLRRLAKTIENERQETATNDKLLVEWPLTLLLAKRV